jgi:hypothetical protein
MIKMKGMFIVFVLFLSGCSTSTETKKELVLTRDRNGEYKEKEIDQHDREIETDKHGLFKSPTVLPDHGLKPD